MFTIEFSQSYGKENEKIILGFLLVLSQPAFSEEVEPCYRQSSI